MSSSTLSSALESATATSAPSRTSGALSSGFNYIFGFLVASGVICVWYLSRLLINRRRYRQMQGLGGPRLGLGMRPGQGPPMGTLSSMHSTFSAPTKRPVTLFVGSISGGITDDFLAKLLAVPPPPL